MAIPLLLGMTGTKFISSRDILSTGLGRNPEKEAESRFTKPVEAGFPSSETCLAAETRGDQFIAIELDRFCC